MALVERSALVEFSAAQMFDLVQNVPAYPEFLPWCGGARVDHLENDGMQATIVIDFAGVRQSFTTRNRHTPPSHIQVALVDGPFSLLQGDWKFIELAPDACKVVFKLEYRFSNFLLEKLIGPVFSRIAASFVDSFVKRARQRYGQGAKTLAGAAPVSPRPSEPQNEPDSSPPPQP